MKKKVKMKGKKTELIKEKNKESAKGEGRTRSTETETMNEVQNSQRTNVQRRIRKLNCVIDTTIHF